MLFRSCQNKPVGLITYNKYHICDFKFSGIIISKKYQNRGFATKLIKHAIEFGKNQNHKNIAVLSKEKSSLFENFGFKPFEKQYNVEKGYKFLKLDL